MKKQTLNVTFIVGLMMLASNVNAETLTFTGTLTDGSCDIAVPNQTIPLGSVRVADFAGKAPGEVLGTAQGFTIEFSNCAATTAGIDITFGTDPADASAVANVFAFDPAASGASAAAATGFVINNMTSGTPVVVAPNQLSPNDVTLDGDNGATLTYEAQLAVVNATDAAAGNLSKALDYTVSYR